MSLKPLVNLYALESDILFGEPSRLLPPRKLNPLLEKTVTLPSGEKVTVEAGCSICEYGAIELDTEPCRRCNGISTPENPYAGFTIQSDYDPSEEYFN